MPIIISDDEDGTGYPTDDSRSYDKVFAAAAANAISYTSSPATLSEEFEDDEPKSGAYLECTVCGTLFDLTARKTGQPWHVVFVGRTVGVFCSL
jgi:hypothetical protein